MINFLLVEFQLYHMQNSTKDYKCRLSFGNICIGSGARFSVGCVLTCNEINFVSLATISTISEVIVRVKRNIKQNRNWFYFKFSVESSSFIFNNFRTEKFKLTFEG